MKLRTLKKKDAPLMLEWMHDPSVVEGLHADFASKTLEDCERFIVDAQSSETDRHFAIVDDAEDVYLGTVSLKHIASGAAEFAIVVRTAAMGRGIAAEAMRSILDYGINELELQKIYWCVSPKNGRAVRFYDKNGYERTGVPREATGYTEEEKDGFLWYQVGRHTA